jgi:predicted DNA-binding protein with PD1-like motif
MTGTCIESIYSTLIQLKFAAQNCVEETPSELFSISGVIALFDPRYCHAHVHGGGVHIKRFKRSVRHGEFWPL